jgi:biofilm protein TabA
MILSELQNKNRYINLHPLFGKAFAFLEKENLSQLSEGKLEIDGDDLFAIISKPGTSAEEIPKLEAHKKYIDIHYIIAGTELFGWKNLNDCKGVEGEFDFEKDYVLYNDQDFTNLLLNKNAFVVIYPEDAHSPGIKTEQLHKVVLKIKL